ncbi:MAG: NADH-quinone oxidoreductase subunit C [Gammaproteobacteria bacterium]|nr:NADH-quinone oxidoreductase subunit C [Gammaproteobacteria bacterium]
MTTRIQQLSDRLQKTFGSTLQSNIVEFKEVTVEVAAMDLLSVCKTLRDDKQFAFEQLIDVCGVDYSEYGSCEWATKESSSTGFSRGVDSAVNARLRFGEAPAQVCTDRPRFAAVYHFLSITNNQRMRVRVYCEDEFAPMVPSVVDLWPVANWFEREAFDLFGIMFEGHPDLRRILTDYGFVGHPFRKDFPLIGHVEMRYDEEQKRVIYQPVTIEPRVLVPKVIREDDRFETETPVASEENSDA